MAMVVMALVMAMVVMVLVITADGTVKDLPKLMPMPIMEDIMATDGDILMDMATTDVGTAKDRPMLTLKLMPMPKLTHITEDTTDMEVMEVTEDTEDIMVDIVDTTGDKNLV